MAPWEKTFLFFWSHLLALIRRRNVGTREHLRKEIILLKYQFFRFRTKSGGQFQLLNWLEKSTKLLMLEDYDIVHFTIWMVPKFRNMYNKRQELEPLFVHLLSSPKSTFLCLTCTQQLMTKAGVQFGMLWRLY